MIALFGRCIFSLILLLAGLWAILALHFQLPVSAPLRWLACGVWAVATLLALMRLGRKGAGRVLAVYAGAFALLLVWWVSIPASDERDWADDVARHLDSRVDGHMLHLGNVRNFDWRSDNDYTVHWEQRSYDLDRLRSVDVALSYWMGPAIAHTLVSFGFDDGKGGMQQLLFTIEIRKERHEKYNAVAGFFKQYELAMVATDERDALRVRTNVRGEDVYLYRVNMPQAAMRSLLLAYLHEAAELRREPRFYNTITANCTTLIYAMARRIDSTLPLDWRLLASGYLPEYLQKVGALTPGTTLPALRDAGRITLRAQAANQSPKFSEAIRAGIPPLEVTGP